MSKKILSLITVLTVLILNIYGGIDGIVYPIYLEGSVYSGAGNNTNISGIFVTNDPALAGVETNLKWACNGTRYFITNLDKYHTNKIAGNRFGFYHSSKTSVRLPRYLKFFLLYSRKKMLLRWQI